MGRIALRVQPGAAKRRVAGRVGEEWKIAVTAPPVGGKANQACVEWVAEICGVPKSAVKLVAGASSRHKIFEVEGRAPDEIDEAFRAAGAGAR